RAADRRAGDNGVFERLAGKDIGRLEVLVHDLHRAAASLVGDLAALAVGSRDGGAARQRQPEGFGERIHGRGRAHGVAMADRRRRRRDDVEEFLVVDPSGGVSLPCPPDYGARSGALPLPQPLSIGPPESTTAGVFTVAAAMIAAGVVLSQPVVSTT